MYHICEGNINDFEEWHTIAKTLEGISAEGKVNKVQGILVPDNQRTYFYSSAVKHPVDDKWAWLYGDYPESERATYTLEEIQTMGFFPLTI